MIPLGCDPNRTALNASENTFRTHLGWFEPTV